ncbi:hypothetical protein [Sutcliffiella halmapala]|uniref:hypothetical protein n=1 Tax=Sutcliffiella halmapala TaxID=79882 RepID=UPI001474BECD|nr:hypothetical protein [Sutcliffiella halmapala]
MTNKKSYIKGSRTPSMDGRGTTTVKREVFGQKRYGNTCKSNEKSTKPSATRLSNK